MRLPPPTILILGSQLEALVRQKAGFFPPPLTSILTSFGDASRSCLEKRHTLSALDKDGLKVGALREASDQKGRAWN